MATPRKTASKAEAFKVSQIGDFKARMGGPQTLPSGLNVIVKNPGGLQAFIANGTIPNSLLTIVKDALDTKSSKEEMVAKAQNLSKDVESIGEMMQLMDIIASQVIVKPRVYKVPTQEDVDRHNILNPGDQVTDPFELRDEERLYTDDIEEQDKMFLFQWITGGTRDLETFRKEYERNVGLVSAGEGSKDAAVADDGADAR